MAETIEEVSEKNKRLKYLFFQMSKACIDVRVEQSDKPFFFWKQERLVVE
jgi:hypothetical protein